MRFINLPVHLPLVKDNINNVDWLKQLSLIADNTKQTYVQAVTINPTSVSANTTSEQTFTVTGVETTDFVRVTKPSHTAGISIGNVRVSAKDTVAITFANNTAGAIDPPSESYLFFILKV